MVSDEDGRVSKYHQSLFTIHSLKAFNRGFAIRPRASQVAWRKVQKYLDLNRFISFRNMPTDGNDNTVRLGGLILDIPPFFQRRYYAKVKVETRQLLNGFWRIYNGGSRRIGGEAS